MDKVITKSVRVCDICEKELVYPNECSICGAEVCKDHFKRIHISFGEYGHGCSGLNYYVYNNGQELCTNCYKTVVGALGALGITKESYSEVSDG